MQHSYPFKLLKLLGSENLPFSYVLSLRSSQADKSSSS